MPRNLRFPFALASAALCALGACLSVPAHAGSLTTTFASNNGFYGNMFDVTVFTPLTITGFDFNISDAVSTHSIAVYYKSGSCAGSETTAADWTLFGTQSGITSAGRNLPTFVDLSGLSLSPGSTYGFYVTTTDGSAMNYTDGAGIFANGDLQIEAGIGKGSLFVETFQPRIWNGTIHYTANASAGASATTVPEPGSLALLVGALMPAGGALLIKKRRR